MRRTLALRTCSASPSPLEERGCRLNIDCRKKAQFSTHNPTHKMRRLVRLTLRLAVPARLVSCSRTYSRNAVTAEVASSSLVVPAISFQGVTGRDTENSNPRLNPTSVSPPNSRALPVVLDRFLEQTQSLKLFAAQKISHLLCRLHRQPSLHSTAMFWINTACLSDVTVHQSL
jgi:hypothetical protein